MGGSHEFHGFLQTAHDGGDNVVSSISVMRRTMLIREYGRHSCKEVWSQKRRIIVSKPVSQGLSRLPQPGALKLGLVGELSSEASRGHGKYYKKCLRTFPKCNTNFFVCWFRARMCHRGQSE